MKTVRTIQNIFSFNLRAKLLASNKDDVLNLEGNKQFHLENPRFIIYINEGLKIILNNRNIGFIINDDSLEKFDNELRIIGNTDKYLLLYDRQNDTKSIYSIFDKVIIFNSYEEVGSFIGGNFLVTDFNSIIKLTDISSKNILMEFPLSTLGIWLDGSIEKTYQVAEFSGIYENTLVCTLTSGDILLLDIQTGEVKAFLKNCIAYNLLQIDDSPIFCGLYGYSFVKINATTGKILNSIDLKPLWKELGRNSVEHYVYIGVCIYQDGLLYFLNRNTVGIFDPSTCKIIDFHEFDFQGKSQQLKGGKENLQVKDGKIYCLDTMGNLYELESNTVK